MRGAGGDVDAVWADGEQAERRALFERLRRSDPAAARELLERTFAEETWEDRAAFVAALAHGLSDADEPFLEAALDDSRKPVRNAAATLLARPARARASPRGWPRAPRRCCASRTALRGRRLVVELPASPTPPPSATASRRRPPLRAPRRAARRHAARHLDRRRGRRRRAAPETATGAAAPPTAAGSPADAAPAPAASRAAAPTPLVAATAPASPPISSPPVADDLAEIVHAGWADAAIAQRDAAWARALWPVHPDSRLLTVLPQDEAEALAAAADAPDDAAAGAARAVGPGALEGRDRRDPRTGARRVSAGRTSSSRATGSTRRSPPRPRSGCAPLGGRDLHRLCDILAARAAMLRELS